MQPPQPPQPPQAPTPQDQPYNVGPPSPPKLHRWAALAAVGAFALTACSFAHAQPSGRAPTATLAMRTPSPQDETIYRLALSSLNLKGTEAAIEGLGLMVCNMLDGGADARYVGDKLIPWVEAAGGNVDAAATLTAAAVVNFCPEHVNEIQGSK